jgi:hypothetical protein
MEEYDEPELVEPEDFLPRNPFPADAQRHGLDRWSGDAAFIALAASLKPDKQSHRMIAWVMLAAFLLPVAGGVWSLLRVW